MPTMYSSKLRQENITQCLAGYESFERLVAIYTLPNNQSAIVRQGVHSNQSAGLAS